MLAACGLLVMAVAFENMPCSCCPTTPHVCTVSDAEHGQFDELSGMSGAAKAMTTFEAVIERLELLNIPKKKTATAKAEAMRADFRLIIEHWKRRDKENYPHLKPLNDKERQRIKRLRDCTLHTPVPRAYTSRMLRTNRCRLRAHSVRCCMTYALRSRRHSRKPSYANADRRPTCDC